MSLAKVKAVLLGLSSVATVTWNPSDKSTNITLSAGNLTATGTANSDGAVRATHKRSSGKHYFEINMQVLGGAADTGAGLANTTATLSTLGNTAANVFMQFRNGAVYKDTVNLFNNGSMAGTGILRVAYDADAHLAWVAFASGNWNNSPTANPATGTEGQDVSGFDSGGLFPVFSMAESGDQCTANFGASSFNFTTPSGFSAWNVS